MKVITLYLGLDVHRDSITIAIAEPRTVRNAEPGITDSTGVRREVGSLLGIRCVIAEAAGLSV